MRSLFKNLFNSPMRSPTAEESYAFKLHLTPGALPYDEVTSVPASCSISGVRYGLVKGVVSSFASNMPPVEDEGLRGCPAFTQRAKYSEDLTNAAWFKSNILAPVLAETFQGQNVWNCAETTTESSYHILNQSADFSAVADNSVIGMSVVAKYSGRKLLFTVQAKDGTYNTSRINLQTGVVESNSGVAASITPLGSGYYRLFFAVNVLTGATSPSMSLQFDNGVSNKYTGDGVSGVYLGQPTYIDFGVNGIPFIPPYVLNNTGSSVSVVSEAGTSTTGTSFDLDAATLVRNKKIFMGSTSGMPELHNPLTDVVGYFTTNSTIDALNMDNNTRTTAWIPTTGVSIFEIANTGTRNRVQCKKDDGTILFLQDSAAARYRITVPSGYTYFRIYYEADIRTNPTAMLSVKAVVTQGHIELKFKSNFDSSWLANNTDVNLWSVNNATYLGLKVRKGGSGDVILSCFDGTNGCDVLDTITVGRVYSIIIDFGTYIDGSQKMRITVNGVKSSVVAFSGSFGTQDLRFFYGNTIHAGWIKNLSYSEKPLW